MNTLFGLPVALDALIRVLIIVSVMTVVVMGLIYVERKVLARFQQRLGPTRTGPMGLLQSVADALKLVAKEDVRPTNADPWVFELAPFLVFVPTFLGFVVVPFALAWSVRDLDLGLFYILAVSSVNIVGWVMAGWASDNRYAMLGALRAVAQSISYELPLVMAMIAVAMVADSQRDRARAGDGAEHRVAAAAVPDVLHLHAGRDEPPAVRHSGRRVGSRRWSVRRVQRHPLVDVLPG